MIRLPSQTYGDEQRGKRGNHSQAKYERDHLGRALRVRAEGVLDFGLLAIAEGLLVGRRGRVRVCRDLNVEDGSVESLGGAEGANDDGCLERLSRDEELDGEVLVRLQCARQQSDETRAANGSLTIWTAAFPLSLTVNGNGASSPDSCSCNTRNAWCGRFPLPLSFAVKPSFNVSVLPSETGFERGVF